MSLFTKPRRSLRILVVEDHPDTLTSVCKFLERAGHRVAAAQTMDEALSLYSEEGCDLLLADFHLPDGNAVELLRGIAVTGKAPKAAIAMSMFDSADIGRVVEEAGYGCFMRKPFRLAKLLKIIDELS